jgi:hypothetical protein
MATEGDIIVKCSTQGCGSYTNSSPEDFIFFKEVNWKCRECVIAEIMEYENQESEEKFVNVIKDLCIEHGVTEVDEKQEAQIRKLLHEAREAAKNGFQ